MYETASTGYSPIAVSAESISADVPSSTAFATSLASARVGSGWWIIVSSICVAVITGFPRSSARWMIRFWRSGTDAGPISTPRSPRATITASASWRISSSASIASDFSIFAITCACESACAMSARRSRTSAAERTNESATKSTPSLSANSRSSVSFRVSAGIGIGTPGRFTPLWELTGAADHHRAARAALLDLPTSRRTWPSSISTSWPGRSTSLITAGLTGRSPSLASCAPTITISWPRSSAIVCEEIADPELRALEVGDQRDRPADLFLRLAQEPTRSRRARSCVPWEKLRRALSMPARISASIVSLFADAGPIVATIFVRRGSTADMRLA